MGAWSPAIFDDDHLGDLQARVLRFLGLQEEDVDKMTSNGDFVQAPPATLQQLRNALQSKDLVAWWPLGAAEPSSRQIECENRNTLTWVLCRLYLFAQLPPPVVLAQHAVETLRAKAALPLEDWFDDQDREAYRTNLRTFADRIEEYGLRQHRQAQQLGAALPPVVAGSPRAPRL